MQAFPRISLVIDNEIGRNRSLGRHHGNHAKTIFAGEIQIPLIVGGAAENGSCAVFH